jgi:cytochrome c-type biogenesis protein CcmH/NrfG/predicted O-methyltransferase YrrM
VRGTEAQERAIADALRAHKKGGFEDAIAGYRAAALEHPGFVDAWMNLGSALVAIGAASSAISALITAAELAPNDARVHRDVGTGLLAIGRNEEASRALERSLALEPGSIGALLLASRTSAELGQRERSIAHALRAVELDPDRAASWLELHRALFDDRNVEPSIEAALRARSLDPSWWQPAIALQALALLAPADSRLRDAGTHPFVRSGAGRAVQYVASSRAASPDARVFATSREVLVRAADASSADVVIELGVRHGVSTRILADAVRERPTAVVHGFDSFEGLPEPFYSKPTGAFSTQGEVARLPENVRIHVGWFDTTLPKWLEENDSSIGLLHVDSDLYASAKTGLDLLGPRLRAGSVIVFDEYLTNEHWEDEEHRAFTEAVARFGWRFEGLAWNFFTGQAVMRLV